MAEAGAELLALLCGSSEVGAGAKVRLHLAANPTLALSRHDAATGETPLYVAACTGNVEACRWLLAAGADTEEGRVENSNFPLHPELSGATPLVGAVIHSQYEVAEVLLAAGCQRNATYRGGKNALTTAAQLGNGRLVDLLLRHRCNPNHAEADGWTALLIACLKGYEEMARALVRAGASRDAVTRDGHSLSSPVLRVRLQSSGV